MAYRSGTYVAFHAAGTSDPTASDMKYYNMLKAWDKDHENDFYFVNSHEKAAAVRETSSKQRLRDVLAERLRNSKNMILILGKTTRFDNDWVPFEIEYAVDKCKIPIIRAYPSYAYIQKPETHYSEWPAALAKRISNRTAHVIHVPFKRNVLIDAGRAIEYPLQLVSARDVPVVPPVSGKLLERPRQRSLLEETELTLHRQKAMAKASNSRSKKPIRHRRHGA